MLVDVQLDGVEGRYALAEVEELIRAGRIGPETPVRADGLTGGRWMAAGELEIYRGLEDSPERKVREAWTNAGIPWFTALLVGIELRVFFWLEPGATGLRAFELLSRDSAAIREGGELWRLFTYSLLHVDSEHIGANLVLLAWVGVALEGVLGGAHLAGLYVFSVVLGGLFGSFGGGPPSVGASGGDFGFFAAAVVFGLRHGDLLPRRARPRFGALLGLYAAWVLVNGVIFGEQVDNMGHLGGAIGGAVYAFFSRPGVTPAWRARNRRVALASVATMLAFGAALLAWPRPLTPVEEDGLEWSRPAWWEVGWTATGDRGWVSTLTDSTVAMRSYTADLPPTLDDEVAHLLADYQALDPAARLEDRVDGERRRLTVEWTLEGAPRRTEALVQVRGRTSWRITLEAAPGSRDLAYAERMFAETHLGVPEELEAALRPAVTWRDRLKRAEALDTLGRSDEAAVELAAAAREGKGVAIERALVDHLRRYPTPDAAPRIEAALDAWPADTQLRSSAVRALVRCGERDRALRRLDEALVARPDVSSLLELRAELFPDAPATLSGATPPSP